jgi:hypothetical protein
MVNINPWRCDIKNEPYLQKAYKKEENARVLVCYHRALAKEIMSPTNHLKGIKNLVVCEAHLFEKHVLNATAKTLSLDYMLEKNNIPSDITQTLEFFFGMLSVLSRSSTNHLKRSSFKTHISKRKNGIRFEISEVSSNI